LQTFGENYLLFVTSSVISRLSRDFDLLDGNRGKRVTADLSLTGVIRDEAACKSITLKDREITRRVPRQLCYIGTGDKK